MSTPGRGGMRALLLAVLLAFTVTGSTVDTEDLFAIVVLGASRPTALGNALDSILHSTRQHPTVSAEVLVVADRTKTSSEIHNAVLEEATKRGIEAKSVYIDGAKSPSAHLATVYKTMFDHVFVERRFMHAVFLEDDLIVSPDFALYFDLARGALKSDPTLFCVSAWNDRGHFTTSMDESRVMRGEHFMGLGWMISRERWSRLLLRMWPSDKFFDVNPHYPTAGQEWDDFMRKALWTLAEKRTAAGGGVPLECAFPEVPRVHHTLDDTKAYSTSSETQRVLFDSMRLSSGKVSPDLLARSFAALTPLTLYDGRLMRSLEQAVPIALLSDIIFYRNAHLVYICQACDLMADGLDPNDPWRVVLGGQLRVADVGYDNVVRGIHNGLVQLRMYTNLVSVVSARSGLIRGLSFRPPAPSAVPSPMITCSSAPSDPAKDLSDKFFEGASGELFIISQDGLNCEEVCKNNGDLLCAEELLMLPSAMLCPGAQAWPGAPSLCTSCCESTEVAALSLQRGGKCQVPRPSVASCLGERRDTTLVCPCIATSA